MKEKRAEKISPQRTGENIIYIVEDEFSESDLSNCFQYAFEVPDGTNEIQFHFSYFPKYLEDPVRTKQLLKTAYTELITEFDCKKDFNIDELTKSCFKSVYPLGNGLWLSIYQNEGMYVGDWNLSSDTSSNYSWINEYGSSRGLKPCKTTAGTWRIEICVGNIVTEKCCINLKITAMREATSAVTMEMSAKQDVDGGNIAIEAGNSGWYSGQLHVHSNHSDGKNTVDDIAQQLQAEGLDFFALTDHNTISGWNFFRQNQRILMIKGVEIGLNKGHAVCLGIKTCINWRAEDGKIRNINDVIREIHQQNGIFILAHHFALGYPVYTGCSWRFRELEDYRLIDLLEVWFHPHNFRKIETALCFKLWNDLLNSGLKLTGISSLDCHDVNIPRELRPVPKNMVFAEAFSEAGIIDGIKKGHVFSTIGPKLYFVAENENKKYMSGDEISVRTSEQIIFTIALEDLNPPCRLIVIKNGNVLWTRDLHSENQKMINFAVTANSIGTNSIKHDWYRCELYEFEGDQDLICFTNPIYITRGND